MEAKSVIPCECGKDFKNRINLGRGMTLYPPEISTNKREFRTAYKCRECNAKWEM